jgi:predicted RNA-binding protein with PUA domain
VTEKNEKMEFLIKEKKEFYEKENCTIIFWAEGNKPISVDINTENFVKHSKYNAYIITNITEFKEYVIIVKASLGDFVDVGVIFINNDEIYNELLFISEDILKIFLKKKYF